MSAIDYGKLRRLTAGKLVKALEGDGFYRKRRRGSHHRYAHADGHRVTVTFHHSGQTFKIGTLQSMVGEQADPLPTSARPGPEKVFNLWGPLHPAYRRARLESTFSAITRAVNVVSSIFEIVGA